MHHSTSPDYTGSSGCKSGSRARGLVVTTAERIGRKFSNKMRKFEESGPECVKECTVEENAMVEALASNGMDEGISDSSKGTAVSGWGERRHYA